MTIGWVNYQGIVILRWTNPLRPAVIYISKYSSRLCCSFKSFWTLEEFNAFTLGVFLKEINIYIWIVTTGSVIRCQQNVFRLTVVTVKSQFWLKVSGFLLRKVHITAIPAQAHPPQFCFLKSVEETSENSRQTCTSDNTVGHSVIYDMQMCKNVPLGVQQLVTGIFFVPYLLINVHNSTLRLHNNTLRY